MWTQAHEGRGRQGIVRYGGDGPGSTCSGVARYGRQGTARCVGDRRVLDRPGTAGNASPRITRRGGATLGRRRMASLRLTRFCKTWWGRRAFAWFGAAWRDSYRLGRRGTAAMDIVG